MTDERTRTLQRRITELEAEIAILRQSTSWRITAPLRAAIRRRPSIAVPLATGPADDDAALVTRFESLGDNCEFGLMQRRVGADRMTLLRYGGARNTGRLIEAVRSGFEGFGTVTDLDMYIFGTEWIALSLRYGFSFHTGHPLDDVHPEIIREATSPKLMFMAGLLLQDMASGEKIFVRRVDEGDTRAGMRELARALRRRGPSVLLWVVRANGVPHATIEREAANLYVAYHGDLGSYGNATVFREDLWISLLRKAEAVIRRRRPLRPFETGV